MPVFNLTDAFVKGAQCKPGAALAEYRDTSHQFIVGFPMLELNSH